MAHRWWPALMTEPITLGATSAAPETLSSMMEAAEALHQVPACSPGARRKTVRVLFV